jgi:hypothetical protein
VPDARLEERHARKAAMALERALELCRANHQPPDADLRETAALLATAVPLAAVNLPLLLLAAGPQVARTVRVEARRLAASRLDPGGAGSASSVLTVREAARAAGVTCQAIRAQAAADRFVGARKDPVTGVWRIPVAAFEEWMEERNAA